MSDSESITPNTERSSAAGHNKMDELLTKDSDERVFAKNRLFVTEEKQKQAIAHQKARVKKPQCPSKLVPFSFEKDA